MKEILQDYSQEEIAALVAAAGEPKYRAGQLFRGLMRGGRISDISDLPKAFKAKLLERIEGMLTEEEHDIFRRGRNAKKPTKSKNASVAEYNISTGFEAVVGFLYLVGDYARIDELFAGEQV